MKRIQIAALLLLIVTPPTALALEPAAARLQGMGGTGAALPEDAATVFYNPAGLFFHSHIALDFCLGFDDLNLPPRWGISYLKYMRSERRGAGFGIYRLTPAAETPDGDAIAAILSTVYVTPMGIPLGLSFKYINENWEDDMRHSYFTGDAGIYLPVGDLLVGIALQSFTNPPSHLLPLRTRAGISYRIGRLVTAAVQGEYASWDEAEDPDLAEYRMGLEFQPSSSFSLQAGKVICPNEEYWTGGFGLSSHGGATGLFMAYHWYPEGDFDDRFYISYRFFSN